MMSVYDYFLKLCWVFMVFLWFQVGFFMVPGWFSWFLVGFHGSWSVFVVVHDSRLVFHGFRLVFQGYRLVFHGSKWVVMVFKAPVPDFHGSRLVFMVFHGSRLVFHGFSPKCTRPNCIMGQRSSLGPLPRGRHRT